MHRKRTSLIVVFFLLGTLGGGLGWLVYAPVRWERRNRALIAAITQNDTKAALALLEQGADPNTRDEPPKQVSIWQLLLDRLRGKHPAPSQAPTALMLAIDLPENIPLIRALLDKGANPNVIINDDDTPLLRATEAGISSDDDSPPRNKTILLLLEHGANVNLANSPLFWAIFNHLTSDEVIRAMLDRGANVDVQWYGGLTPLNVTIQLKQVERVKMLLAHHARLTREEYKDFLTDSKELTDYISTPAGRQIVQMLKKAGAKK